MDYQKNWLVLNIFIIKKAAVILNFCLFGNICHNFLIPTMIESAPKTFKPIQTPDQWMVIIYFFCQQPPPTTRNTAAQMTTRTNTARGASGGPLKPAGAAPSPSAAPVKKESTPYKPLPIPPTFDLDLDSTQLKEAIAKLGYDPNGKIPTSLLVRPKANSSIPGRYWIKFISTKYYKEWNWFCMHFDPKLTLFSLLC